MNEMDDAVRLVDFRQRAADLLPEHVWNYVEGGAGDEHTVERNASSWQDIELLPRVLVDASTIDTRVQMLGHDLVHPILLAPTASHQMYHPGAEAATLEGAGRADALPVMSTLGSTPVEDLGLAAQGPWWFQLYVQPDRAFTSDLVQRAAAAGASALVLTVDTPVLGARDRDRRKDGHTVDGLSPPNLAVIEPPDLSRLPPHQRIFNPHIDPTVTWDTLDWLIDVSPIPVLAKGVIRADDAQKAVDAGVAAVIVSNHGARNLDTTVPTSRALPRVAEAVDGRVPILVDGGIRRGTDVAKALCLGANAVLIGRPAIWGLTTDGADGVAHIINMLRAELGMAMALLGAPSIPALTADLLDRPSVRG
jgi:4-hydroxymandelate oxidase